MTSVDIQRRLRDGNSDAKRRRLGKDMAYTFEHDVPVPTERIRQRWPFDQLEVAKVNKQGQLVGTCLRFNKDCANTVRAASSVYRKAHPGTRFTIRCDDDVCRCWRIA
jgi:hypothetical protein